MRVMLLILILSILKVVIGTLILKYAGPLKSNDVFNARSLMILLKFIAHCTIRKLNHAMEFESSVQVIEVFKPGDAINIFCSKAIYRRDHTKKILRCRIIQVVCNMLK